MSEKVVGLSDRIQSQVTRKSGPARLTRADQVLRERLAMALRHAMPEYAQQKAWVQWLSRQTGIPARRIESHMAGEHRCTLGDGLAYFDFLGAEFERQARGT